MVDNMQGLRTKLVELLHEKPIEGRRKGNQYTCIHADFKCIIPSSLYLSSTSLRVVRAAIDTSL